MYERSSASVILSYKVRIPVCCASAASTLEFSNCHYYVGQEMCTPYGKQEAVLIPTTCDVILSRSPRAPWLAATASTIFAYEYFDASTEICKWACNTLQQFYCSIYFILFQTSAHVCNKCCNFLLQHLLQHVFYFILHVRPVLQRIC